jgi:chromosome segregation ATPase
MRIAMAAALAAALLSGCQSMEAIAPARLFAPAPAARIAPGAELVAYLARIRDLGDKPLAAETQRQREAARAQGSELETVKLGIALSLAPTSDDGEIATLMEPISRRANADDDVRAMASFLLVQSAERRRLKEGLAAAGSRLRDERRALEAQKQRTEALEQRATQLQERAAQLQQKIDALTELEKSLSDRQSQNR